MNDRLYIFDTTLRDGEQSPGASMTAAEKIRIARQLEKLKVDIIEAGFPAASPGDSDAVKMVAKEIRESRICGLARANPGDVEKAAEAVKGANAPRIHTFIATSPIHMKAKLRMCPRMFWKRLCRLFARRGMPWMTLSSRRKMRVDPMRIFSAESLRP